MNGTKKGVVLKTAIVLCMTLLMSVLAGCSTLQAGERGAQPKTLQDQIWPEFPPLKRVMSKQNQQYAEAALIRWVEACSDFRYEVVDQRFLWLRPDYTAWSALVKSHWSRMGTEKWRGERVELECDVPGYNPIIVWRIVFEGKPRFFAITMTHVPVPGSGHRRLLGRFELEMIRDK